jgi:hypothetical protein
MRIKNPYKQDDGKKETIGKTTCAPVIVTS